MSAVLFDTVWLIKMAWLYMDYHGLFINQRTNLKMPATMLKMILAPSRVGRLNCRGAMRVPVEGSDELHWARGVRTAIVQLVDNKFKSTAEGLLNCMRNDPKEFVIALEISVDPHLSCALASAQMHFTSENACKVEQNILCIVNNRIESQLIIVVPKWRSASLCV